MSQSLSKGGDEKKLIYECENNTLEEVNHEIINAIESIGKQSSTYVLLTLLKMNLPDISIVFFILVWDAFDPIQMADASLLAFSSYSYWMLNQKPLDIHWISPLRKGI